MSSTKQEPKTHRLDFNTCMQALLVPVVSIGLGIVLLLAFKFHIAETLPVLMRLVAIMLIWFGMSVAALRFLDRHERARARAYRERAAQVVAAHRRPRFELKERVEQQNPEDDSAAMKPYMGIPSAEKVKELP